MRGVNRFLESRKHTIHVTGFREQRQLPPKAPQMETPKKSKPAAPRNQETSRAWGIRYMGGKDGMGLGGKAADTNGFLLNIYFSPSP